MLVAAAVVPCPPVLVPEVAAGAAAALAGLRDACRAAVQSLGAAQPDVLVVVGPASSTAAYDADARGCLDRFGAPITGGGAGAQTLPLSLTVGRWLAGDGWPALRLQAVASTAGADECGRLGAALVGGEQRVALLVAADGCASRVDASPVHHDPRAVPFDDAVAAALGSGDTGALLALDAVLAAELAAAGRPAWQVLAGAAAGPVVAELVAYEAPYGVGYFVATWRPE